MHPIILTIVTRVYARAGSLSILTKFGARISIFFVSFTSRKSAAICAMDTLLAIFAGIAVITLVGVGWSCQGVLFTEELIYVWYCFSATFSTSSDCLKGTQKFPESIIF